MSSLLQFDGAIRRNRHGNGVVGLQFIKAVKGPDWDRFNGPTAYRPSPDSTVFTVDDPSHVDMCAICGKAHARIYVAWRRPIGMLGCWVVFRYNGAEHVPDLSVPISTLKLPRDARYDPDVTRAFYHPRGEQ